MKTIKNLLLSAAVALCGSILPAGAQTDAGKTVADVPMVKLNNGMLMPRFGLGTFLQGSDGFSVIPGATNPDYIKENIQIFDFSLTDEEMQTMRSLNKEQRFFQASLE